MKTGSPDHASSAAGIAGDTKIQIDMMNDILKSIGNKIYRI